MRRSEIVGVFPAPSPHEIVAEWLCLEVEVGAERYDRAVCTGCRDGTAMPVTPEERHLITRNAIKARQWMRQIAAVLMIDAGLLRCSRRSVERLTFDAQVALLDRVRELVMGHGVNWRECLQVAQWGITR